jgi:hypothetical protein
MVSRARGVGLALALGLVGAILSAPLVAGAQSSLGLEALRTVDGSPLSSTDELTLEVRPGETGAATEFVLRQTDGNEPISIQLRGVVGGKAIDFAVDGAAVGQPIVVPESGKVVFVTASVDAVVDEMDDASNLVAVADGQAQVIANIRVRKETAAELVLSGAKDGVLAETAAANTFSQEFAVESTTTASTDVVVIVSPLRHDDAGSAATTVTVEGATYDQRTSFPVLGQSTVRFTVSATLSRSGSWKGTISLVYGETRASTALEVNRRRLTPSITIDAVTPARGTLPLVGAPPELRILVRVHETEGQDLTLELPSVLPLLREEGDTSFQTDMDSVRFEVDGRDVEAIALPADGEADVAVVFADLDEPGKYTGSVKFAAPGPTATEKAFSLFVRRSRWTAALIIGASVALSAGVRWYLVSRRGRLKARSRVTQLAHHLNDVYAATGHSTARYELARHVRTRLDALARRLHSGPVPDADVEREALRVELLSRYLTVASQAEASAEPAKHDVELASVAAIIRQDGLSAEERAKGDATLATIEQALSGSGTIAAAIDALRADIDRAAQHAGQGQGNGATLKAWVASCDSAAAQATTEPRSAADTYERVRRAWLDWLLDDLQQRLKEIDPPLGVNQVDWNTIRGEDSAIAGQIRAGREATEPNTKLESYESAVAELVKPLAGGLAHRIRSKAAAVERRDAELSADLSELGDRAATAEAMASVGQATEAIAKYDAAVSAYAGLETRLHASGQKLGATNTVEVLAGAPLDAGAAATSLDTSLPAAPPEPPKLGEVPSGKKAARELIVGELGVNMVLLALAVIVGLVGLYEPSASWGDWGDISVAVLWGFGLHQLGNGAFGGITGLRTTLATPPGG